MAHRVHDHLSKTHHGQKLLDEEKFTKEPADRGAVYVDGVQIGFYHEGKWQERTAIARVKKQRGNKTLQPDLDVEEFFKHDPGNALQWRLGEKCLEK